MRDRDPKDYYKYAGTQGSGKPAFLAAVCTASFAYLLPIVVGGNVSAHQLNVQGTVDEFFPAHYYSRCVSQPRWSSVHPVSPQLFVERFDSEF